MNEGIFDLSKVVDSIYSGKTDIIDLIKSDIKLDDFNIIIYGDYGDGAVWEKLTDRSNIDIQIFSRCLDKMKVTYDTSDFSRVQNYIANQKKLSKLEIENYHQKNEYDFSKYCFEICEGEFLHNVFSLVDLKRILSLLINFCSDNEMYIKCAKQIYKSIIFDDEICTSMDKLKKIDFAEMILEINYHLYIIDKYASNNSTYKNMSYKEYCDMLPLDCSPERSRKTVAEKLTKSIDGIQINCECHTKPKPIRNIYPRIYFCPRVNDEIIYNSLNIKDKAFVYKITTHQ